MFSSMGQTNPEDFGNGGTIDGDLIVVGDLQVNGGGSLSFDEIIQGTSTIKVTNTSAFLIEKGDGTDVLIVDTVNKKLTLNSELQITSTGVANSPALAIDNSSASTFIHSAEIFAGSMTANQTNSIFIGRIGSTKNSAQIGFKYSSAGADANLLTLGHWGVNDSLVINGAGNSTFAGRVALTAFQAGELLGVKSSANNEWGARIENTSSTGYGALIKSGSTSASQLLLQLRGGAVNVLSVKADGDITASSTTDAKPIFKLEQTGNNANAGQLIFLTSGTANDNDDSGVIRFKGMNDASTPEEIEYATIYVNHDDVSNGSEDSTMHFRTQSGGSLDSRLVIKGNNLGIGSSPASYTDAIATSQTLTIGENQDSSDKLASVQIIGRGSSSTDTLGALEFINTRSGSGVVASIVGGRFNGGSASDGSLSFNTKNGSSLTTKMTINDVGNLGIGTNNPAEKLHVNGGHLEVQNGGNTNVIINSASGSDGSIYFQEGGGMKARVYNDASANALVLTDGADTTTLTLSGTTATFASDIICSGATKFIKNFRRMNMAADNDFGINNHQGTQVLLISNASTPSASTAAFSGKVTIADDTTISSAASGGLVLTMQQSNADDNSSELKFVKDSSSPSTGDKLGQITFYGDDDSGTQHNFADIAVLPTGLGNDAGEQATIRFRALNGGAMKTPLTLVGENATFGGIGEFNRNDSLSTGVTNRSLYLKQAGSGDVNLVFSDNQHSFNMGIDNSANAFKISTHSHELHTNTKFTLDTSGNATFAGNVTTLNTNPTLFVLNSNQSADSKIHIGESSHLTNYGIQLKYEGNLGNLFLDNLYNHSTRPHMYFRMRTSATPLTALTINPDATTLFGFDATFAGDIKLGVNDKNISWGANANNKIFGSSAGNYLKFYANNGAKLVLDANSRISLSNNDSGTSNTFFGKLTGDDLVNGGNYNSFFGENAGHAVQTGDYNCAIGLNSLDGATNPQRVTAIGTATMRGNATPDAIGTVAIGYASLNALSSGIGNVACGYESLLKNTDGDKCTAIGHNSLKNQVGTAGGVGNTALGHASGDAITTGYSCTIIGSDSDPSSHNAVNQIVIGQSATGRADHSAVIGNTSVTKIYMNQNGNGKVILGSIEFDANQATLSTNSSTLDDYEEGSWTPVIQFGGNAVDVAYGSQSGKYTKIGDTVFIEARLVLTNNGSSTGTALILGLPFTHSSVATTISLGIRTGVTQERNTWANVAANGTWMNLYDGQNALSNSTVTDTADIFINGSYKV